jgi:hypothetical protein
MNPVFFCVKTIVNYLKNIKDNNIKIIFIDSDVLTMIDINEINQLKNVKVYHINENEIVKYFTFIKEKKKPVFTITFKNEKTTLQTFKPIQIKELLTLLKNFEKNKV